MGCTAPRLLSGRRYGRPGLRRSAAIVRCAVLALLLLAMLRDAAGPGPVAAASSTHYLHAADVTLGSTTYNTATTAGPAGSLDEISASTGGGSTPVVLRDGAAISMFASDPAPAGMEWDIGGNWSFDVFLRAADSRTLKKRAVTIYEVSQQGVATQLFTKTESTGGDLGAGWAPVSWSVSVPGGTIVHASERWAVEFAFETDDPTTVYLGFDTGSQDSRVTAQLTEQAAAGVVRLAHFRIGKDQPLTDGDLTSYYYDSTDAKTRGINRDTSFRPRFQVYNDGGQPVNWRPQLEWAASGLSWAAVPTASGAQPFYLYDTPQFADGAAIAPSDFGLGPGTGAAQGGTAYDAQNPPTSTISLGAGAHTEVEFNVQANANAAFYTAYTFRLTDAGTPLDSYDHVATISVWRAENPASPHYAYGVAPDKCAACHRVHTAQNKHVLRLLGEEQLCYECHDGTGARTNILAAFQKPATHPIAAATGVHTLASGEGLVSGWNQSPRHVECEDCHVPHRSTSGTGASTPGFGDLPNTIAGQWGVTVTNPATEWADVPAGNFTRTATVAAEYQLCMKCHSPYAYGSSPPTPPSGSMTETSMAREFNVNNDSYHWVEADKTAASGFTPRTAAPGRTMTFVAGSGWEAGTAMNCTDCHSSENDSDPRGPHGSNQPFLLRGAWSGSSWGLCTRCHDPNVYGPAGDPNQAGVTGFSGQRGNLHAFHMTKSDVQNGCQSCHSAIPHGYKNRALLVESTVNEKPYCDGCQLEVTTWASPGGWAQTSCGGMMGHCHNPAP